MPLPRPTNLRQTMRNLLDNLEEAGMNFDEVVATNVYLDDLSDVQAFDEVYVGVFRPCAASSNNDRANCSSRTHS